MEPSFLSAGCWVLLPCSPAGVFLSLRQHSLPGAGCLPTRESRHVQPHGSHFLNKPPWPTVINSCTLFFIIVS